MGATVSCEELGVFSPGQMRRAVTAKKHWPSEPSRATLRGRGVEGVSGWAVGHSDLEP